MLRDGRAITWKSSSTPYVTALVVSAVAVRLFASKRIFRGISAGRWAASLGAVASAIKLIEISIRVVRKRSACGPHLVAGDYFSSSCFA
jgi:Na+/glutamate symporter